MKQLHDLSMHNTINCGIWLADLALEKRHQGKFDMMPWFTSHLILLQLHLNNSESCVQMLACVYICQFLLLINKVFAVLALLFCSSLHFDY